MTESERNRDSFDALLRHVIQTDAIGEPPAGFAQEMERRVAGKLEEAGVESVLTRIVMWSTSIAAVGFAVPYASRTAAGLQELLGDAPWPLLLSVLAILGCVKLVEHLPLPIGRSS